MTLLQYKYLAPLGVPIFLSAISIMAKKAARARIRAGWDRHDFYMGIDQTIASLAIPLVNLLDIIGRYRSANSVPSTVWKLLLSNVGALLLTFFLLFVVLSFHQDHESKADEASTQELFWVGLLANVIGFGLLFAWVTLIPSVGS